MITDECSAALGGQTLSESEQAADKILRVARDSMYTASVFLPSKSFFEARPQVAASELFRLLRPLPKGAALHLHFDSLLDTVWFVNVTYEPNCYACWPAGATRPDAFRFMPHSTAAGAPSCASGWEEVAALRSAATDREAFDDAIFRSITMTPASGQAYPSVTAAWDQFQGIFGKRTVSPSARRAVLDACCLRTH